MNNWQRESLPGDWAARPLYRLRDGHQSAILIETVPDTDPAAIDGHRVGPVAAFYQYLGTKNIRVPRVYDVDPARGILILEDFGDDSWARVLNGQNSPEFYDQALAILQQFKSLRPDSALAIPEFQNSYIFGRTRWYLQHYKHIDDRSQLADFIRIWDALLENLHHEPVQFVHGDFHPGNLMRLPDKTMGILDVGGAFWGAGLYDLVNLLEDIRRDVPSEIKTALKKAYGTCNECYAILHAQFYMRLAGQMTKRGMDVPAKIPEGLHDLVNRYDVLKPLKELVLT